MDEGLIFNRQLLTTWRSSVGSLQDRDIKFIYAYVFMNVCIVIFKTEKTDMARDGTRSASERISRKKCPV